MLTDVYGDEAKAMDWRWIWRQGWTDQERD